MHQDSSKFIKIHQNSSKFIWSIAKGRNSAVVRGRSFDVHLFQGQDHDGEGKTTLPLDLGSKGLQATKWLKW